MDWEVFWAVLAVTFIVMPLLFIWGFALVDLFSRPDLGGFGKLLWLLGIIFFPLLGTLLYFIFRPTVLSYRELDSKQELKHELNELADLRNRGVISQEEYDRYSRRLVPTT
jgi:hypothetical protein